MSGKTTLNRGESCVSKSMSSVSRDKELKGERSVALSIGSCIVSNREAPVPVISNAIFFFLVGVEGW